MRNFGSAGFEESLETDTEKGIVPKEEDNKDYHRTDEQLNVCLECNSDGDMKNIKRKFLRLSSQATVSHIKKFVALKLFNDLTKYSNVSKHFIIL